MGVYLRRWETAKTKFERATGVSKPKPTGFFNKFFNHSGLTKSLEGVDVPAEKLSKTSKDDEKKKYVGELKTKYKDLSKAIAEYLKVLETSAKDEKLDNNAKTDLYRHMKVLIAELKAIDITVEQLIDKTEAALSGAGLKDQAAMIFKSSLIKACADAALAVKTIQASPNITTFKKYFAETNDVPGRKIQVQLVAAAKEQEAGKLTGKFTIDPKSVADDLTPWQAQNKNKCHLDDDATPQEVTTRLEEFKKLLKLAARFCEELKALKA